MKTTPFLLLAIASCGLTSCGKIDETMQILEENRQAVQMSTYVIQENIRAIEEANQGIAENRRQLEEINNTLRKAHEASS